MGNQEQKITNLFVCELKDHCSRPCMHARLHTHNEWCDKQHDPHYYWGDVRPETKADCMYPTKGYKKNGMKKWCECVKIELEGDLNYGYVEETL